MRKASKTFSYFVVIVFALVGCNRIDSTVSTQPNSSSNEPSEIKVNALAALDSIEMVEMPYKTEYLLNETINPTGGQIKVNLNDGQSYYVDLDYPLIKDFDKAFNTLGQHLVKVDYKYNGAHQQTEFIVEVIDNHIYVDDIILNQDYLEIYVGQNYVLKPKVMPLVVSDFGLEFWSLNPEIASVDESGVIQAHQVGITLVNIQSHDHHQSKQMIIEVKKCDSPLVTVTLIRESINQLYDKLQALNSRVYTYANLMLIEQYKNSGIGLFYQVATENQLRDQYQKTIQAIDAVPYETTLEEVNPIIETYALIVNDEFEFAAALANQAIDKITLGQNINGNISAIRSAATNLIIDFEDYVLTGNLELTANNITQLTLNGTAILNSITGDLTIEALNASVYNNLDVGGTITINGVSDATWNQNGDALLIKIVADGGAFNLINGTIANGLLLSSMTNNNILKLSGLLDAIELIVEQDAKILINTLNPPIRILVLPNANNTQIENDVPEVTIDIDYTVTDTNIGLVAPIVGLSPASSVTETTQFSGSVLWEPNDDTFEEKVYTATITLSAKAGFTFEGITQDYFNVIGAQSVTNDANSGIVTATFDAITAPPDVIAPILTLASVTNIMNQQATLSVTSNEVGTYYYIVQLATELAPDQATIIAQASGINNGSGAVTLGNNDITISNLADSTSYKVYLIIIDNASNASLVTTLTINTLVLHTNCLLMETPNLINVGLSLALDGLEKANFAVTKNSSQAYTDFTLSGGPQNYALTLGTAAVAGDVFTVLITKAGYSFKGNAILLATVNQTSVSAYSAQISFYHNTLGTFYYLVKLVDEEPPTELEIKFHIGSSIYGAGATVNGNNIFTITNLAAETAYKLYLVVEEHVNEHVEFSNIICSYLTTPVASTTAGILSVFNRDDYILGTQTGDSTAQAITAEISVPNVITTLLVTDVIGTSIDVLLYDDAAFNNNVNSIQLAVGNTIAYIKVTSTVEPVFSKYYAVTITRSSGTGIMASYTITGVVGSTITNADILITLSSDAFKQIAKNSNLVTWIKNIPAGLIVKNPTKVMVNDTTVSIRISGTPTTPSDEPLLLIIPGTFLTSGIDLVITSNPNTKFLITTIQ